MTDNRAMAAGSSQDFALPQFSHQLRAMMAMQDKEDRELVGGSLRRAGFRQQDLKDHSATKARARTGGRAPTSIAGHSGAADGKARSGICFEIASPIQSGSRQTGGQRAPHFDMKRVSKSVVPMSWDGKTHARYPARGDVAGKHIDYVDKGAQLSLAKHYDYILRSSALDHSEYLETDMLDELAERSFQNSVAVFSNIPGGRERQRSLFEAAERCERTPKVNYLTASTADLDLWRTLAAHADAEGWLRGAAAALAGKRTALEKAAKKRNKPLKHQVIKIARVTLEEAYDRLTWFDSVAGADADKLTFQPGRCGRVQTRFVAELPDGLTATERRAVLERFCESLVREGWMIVGAIHQPDKHNDPRNYHMHIDGYDRPSRWLEEHDCWDFEYCVKNARGRSCFPERQNKIAEVARSSDRNISQFEHGRRYVAEKRSQYVDLLNDVIGGRPGVPVYFAGTYKRAGIERTPLKHLGNKVIAAEKEGIVKPAGRENAAILWSDELDACHRRAETSRKAIRRRREASADAEGEGLPDQIYQQRMDVIDDRLHVELTEVVERMLRSRAETVIRHHDRDAVGNKPTANKSENVQAARDWLARVDAIAPSAIDKARALSRFEQRGRKLDDIERHAKDHLEDPIRAELHTMHYRPTVGSRIPSPTIAVAEPFRDQVRERLEKWIDKHVSDETMIRFVDGGFELDQCVPKAVHSQFLKFDGDPSIERRLIAERNRRLAREYVAPELINLPVPVAPTSVARDNMPPPHSAQPNVAVVNRRKLLAAARVRNGLLKAPPAGQGHQPTSAPSLSEAATIWTIPVISEMPKLPGTEIEEPGRIPDSRYPASIAAQAQNEDQGKEAHRNVEDAPAPANDPHISADRANPAPNEPGGFGRPADASEPDDGRGRYDETPMRGAHFDFVIEHLPVPVPEGLKGALKVARELHASQQLVVREVGNMFEIAAPTTEDRDVVVRLAKGLIGRLVIERLVRDIRPPAEWPVAKLELEPIEQAYARIDIYCTPSRLLPTPEEVEDRHRTARLQIQGMMQGSDIDAPLLLSLMASLRGPRPALALDVDDGGKLHVAAAETPMLAIVEAIASTQDGRLLLHNLAGQAALGSYRIPGDWPSADATIDFRKLQRVSGRSIQLDVGVTEVRRDHASDDRSQDRMRRRTAMQSERLVEPDSRDHDPPLLDPKDPGRDR
ncbi:hypothetical protein EAH79_00770 [Sphingomonas koreensis]|nr:hypothetical protein EAH79_00770 [Sphingomonas koreensis]